MRQFLTYIAEQEIHKNSKVYVPSKIIKRNEGGCFIHEGCDNVDIYSETIDGKNTYHAMARVIFQNKPPNNIS